MPKRTGGRPAGKPWFRQPYPLVHQRSYFRMWLEIDDGINHEVKCYLDTGASRSFTHQDYLIRLHPGWKQRRGEIYTTNSIAASEGEWLAYERTFTARLPRGSRATSRLRPFELPLMVRTSQMGYLQTCLVIGRDFLAHFELQLRHRRLYLRPTTARVSHPVGTP